MKFYIQYLDTDGNVVHEDTDPETFQDCAATKGRVSIRPVKVSE